MSSKKPYKKRRIRKWKDIVRFFRKTNKPNDQWIYRGQGNSEWKLQTRFERSLNRFSISFHKASDIEEALLREFKRHAYNYVDSIPSNDLEWLALMQHYGASTRLLDWTYSLYVAVYFAIRSTKGEAAVWALDTNWMDRKAKKVLPKKLYQSFKFDPMFQENRNFQTVFQADNPRNFVFAINPYQINPRLSIQQGIFLCPMDISKPFWGNLKPFFTGNNSKSHFTKLLIEDNKKLRKRILRNLYRMNINEETLFPGLEGYSRSLEHMMHFKHLWKS